MKPEGVYCSFGRSSDNSERFVATCASSRTSFSTPFSLSAEEVMRWSATEMETEVAICGRTAVGVDHLVAISNVAASEGPCDSGV